MNSSSVHVNEFVNSLKVGLSGLALRDKVSLKDVRWQGRASGVQGGVLRAKRLVVVRKITSILFCFKFAGVMVLWVLQVWIGAQIINLLSLSLLRRIMFVRLVFMCLKVVDFGLAAVVRLSLNCALGVIQLWW